MSIVNISSENKASGTEADFQVNLKKSLQRCIGLQLLNVTVPLSYNVINTDDNQIPFVLDGSNYTAAVENGTHGVTELAKKVNEAMNQAIYSDALPSIRNQEQRNIHVTARANILNISIRDAVSITHARQTDVSFQRLEPGMLVEWNNTAYVVQNWDTATNSGTVGATGLLSKSLTESSRNAATNTIHYTDGGTTDTLKLAWPGVLVFYDSGESRIVVSSLAPFSFSTATTSRRMKKTLGLTDDNNSSGQTGALPATHKNKFLNNFLTMSQLPEPAGPSMLFLRIGGDPLLDQQNSETHMNDRIPIPIDQPHGGVVHYENDSESDVIPFSVPCDIRNLKFRLEYGDDNTTVGGDTNNLSGHHVYVRLKFFKLHQQHDKL